MKWFTIIVYVTSSFEFYIGTGTIDAPSCGEKTSYFFTFIVDGVILSERGMTTLKSQTVEKEKTRRRKRVGISDNPMGDMMDNAGDNDDKDDDDEDDVMPPPTPGTLRFCKLFCTPIKRIK